MNSKTRRLIESYLQGTCSEEERGIVEKWLDDWKSKQQNIEIDDLQNEHFKELVLRKIERGINKGKRLERGRSKKLYYLAAAGILVAVLLGTLFSIEQNRKDEIKLVEWQVEKKESNATVLLYADGKKMNLSSLKKEVVLENGIKVDPSGSFFAEPEFKGSKSDSKKLNEIRVPRGSSYELTLMDGTKVFMNSASTLSFPNHFDTKKRIVKLEGEAYFQVTHNKTPFIVEVKDYQVEVLGTEFNVRAYDTGISSTTLIDGKIVIQRENLNRQELRPGQRAVVTKEINIEEVDVHKFASWKDGYFIFDAMSIDEVMGEVARWYDVEYEISANVDRNKKIGGTFSRDKSLQELVNYLKKLIDVKIEINGEKVTVKK